MLALLGLFAFVGWLLDGLRGLTIFAFCALLVAAGAYWTFDRVVLGMIGARELPLGEAPLLHSTVERLAARAGIVKPRLYLIPDGLPIAAATGRGSRGARRSRSAPAARRLRAGRARGRARARDRACAAPRRSGADGGRGLGRGAAGDAAGSAAGSSTRCSSSSGRSPRRASTCWSRRSASSRLIVTRPSSATRRTASPTRSCGSNKPPSSSSSRQPGDRAALHHQPVRGTRARRAVRHRILRSRSACAGCGSSIPPGATATGRDVAA